MSCHLPFVDSSDMVPIEDNEARKSSFNFTSLIFNFLIDLIDVIVSILLGTYADAH